MTFLALIIALLVVQYLGSAQFLHRDDLLGAYFDKLRSANLPPGGELGLALLLFPLLLCWILSATEAWIYGVPVLALTVVVLLYSFGRGDFQSAASSYRNYCCSGDFEAAYLEARQQFPTRDIEATAENPERLHRWMKQRLVYMRFEHWFAVIFYFALFGAAAALIYRISQLFGDRLEAGELKTLQEKVQYLLDWLPARLLIFTFTLTGDYVGSREQMKSSLLDTDSPSDQVISDAAHAALAFKSTVFAGNGDPEAFTQISEWEVGQLQSLLNRSAVAWVVVISLLVVFS